MLLYYWQDRDFYRDLFIYWITDSRVIIFMLFFISESNSALRDVYSA